MAHDETGSATAVMGWVDARRKAFRSALDKSCCLTFSANHWSYRCEVCGMLYSLELVRLARSPFVCDVRP